MGVSSRKGVWHFGAAGGPHLETRWGFLVVANGAAKESIRNYSMASNQTKEHAHTSDLTARNDQIKGRLERARVAPPSVLNNRHKAID